MLSTATPPFPDLLVSPVTSDMTPVATVLLVCHLSQHCSSCAHPPSTFCTAITIAMNSHGTMSHSCASDPLSFSTCHPFRCHGENLCRVVFIGVLFYSYVFLFLLVKPEFFIYSFTGNPVAFAFVLGVIYLNNR